MPDLCDFCGAYVSFPCTTRCEQLQCNALSLPPMANQTGWEQKINNPKPVVYLIGSLRLPVIREFAKELRSHGLEVFDDWHSAGPEADDIWQTYEQGRGHSYKEALYGHHATNAFEFDLKHLTRADVGVMMMPAGKSAHLELGWMLGKGKRGYILLDKEPDRWDLMYRFATGVFASKEALMGELKCGN